MQPLSSSILSSVELLFVSGGIEVAKGFSGIC